MRPAESAWRPRFCHVSAGGIRASFAQPRELRRAEPHMADFVVKDSFQDARAGFVAGDSEALDRHRRDVEPARFEHHRHDRQPRRDVVAGARAPPPTTRRAPAARHSALPSARSRRSSSAKCIASSAATDSQSPTNCGPIVGAEPPRHVEREVDRDEFDVRERVKQRDAAAFRAALAALGHARGRQQFGLRGPGRPIGHRRRRRRTPAGPAASRARRRARRHHLGARIGSQQRGADRAPTLRLAQARPVKAPCAASSTSSAWPLTFTLRQTRAIRPSASTR